MTGFTQINLQRLSEIIGEQELRNIISGFSCPMNADVETFLIRSASLFAKQGIAATHLVFASYQGKQCLAGYFTLANKHFHIDIDRRGMNSELRRRLAKFGQFDSAIKKRIISAPLIAQLGKNYSSGYAKLITGRELLKMACDTVKEIQLALGGRFVYLECEDKSGLVEFYESNGFYNFGQRPLDPDETGLKGKYLVQMLKYLR